MILREQAREGMTIMSTNKVHGSDMLEAPDSDIVVQRQLCELQNFKHFKFEDMKNVTECMAGAQGRLICQLLHLPHRPMIRLKPKSLEAPGPTMVFLVDVVVLVCGCTEDEAFLYSMPLFAQREH